LIELNRWSAAYRAKTSEPRLDADPDQREPPCGLPVGGLRELLVAEFDAAIGVGPVRVRSRQRHRHVQVVDARRERGAEQRHDEARISGVHQGVAAVLCQQCLDGRGIRGVDASGDEAAVRSALDRTLGPALVVVGDHHRFEELPAPGDRNDCSTDPTGTDQQNSHLAPSATTSASQ